MHAQRWAVVFAVALVAVASAHVLEDFAYGVPEERFGIEPTVAAVATGLVFGAQAAAAAAASHGSRSAHAANVIAGVAWVVAAVLDHAGEVLFAEQYRAGIVSKALEVGIVVAGGALGAASLAALTQRALPR